MKEGAVGNNALYVGVGKGLFNDTLSSWLHCVKWLRITDNKRGNHLLPFYGLLINSIGSFISTILIYRIIHTMAFVTPIAKHWLVWILNRDIYHPTCSHLYPLSAATLHLLSWLELQCDSVYVCSGIQFPIATCLLTPEQITIKAERLADQHCTQCLQLINSGCPCLPPGPWCCLRMSNIQCSMC